MAISLPGEWEQKSRLLVYSQLDVLSPPTREAVTFKAYGGDNLENCPLRRRWTMSRIVVPSGSIDNQKKWTKLRTLFVDQASDMQHDVDRRPIKYPSSTKRTNLHILYCIVLFSILSIRKLRFPSQVSKALRALKLQGHTFEDTFRKCVWRKTSDHGSTKDSLGCATVVYIVTTLRTVRSLVLHYTISMLYAHPEMILCSLTHQLLDTVTLYTHLCLQYLSLRGELLCKQRAKFLYQMNL